MLGRNLNGSQIQYISALSPTTFAAAGSTNAYDLSSGRYLTVKVHSDSADLTVNIERSGSSGTGFNQTGLSLTGNASGVRVRSMPLESSAVHYRASYDNNNAGSITAVIEFEVQGQRVTPINQHARTSVWSDVANA